MAIALTVGSLLAQQPPAEGTGKQAAPDPWRAPAATKAEQELAQSGPEFFDAELMRATARTLPKDGLLFQPVQKADLGEQGRETRLPIQIKPDLPWQHLRALLVGVERDGLPWRLRRLQLRAPEGSAPWVDETPLPKLLRVEQLEFVRRVRGRDNVPLPAGTAVLRALQEAARAAVIKDVVIGELTLTLSTPEAAGTLQLVLWLKGQTAPAQVTQLTAAIKKASAEVASPFAKVASLLGPLPREGVAGATVITLSVALKAVP